MVLLWTSAIMFGTWVIASLVYGKWLRNFFLTLGAILVMGGVSYGSIWVYDHLAEHQQTRIDVWFEPSKDPQGVGYNVIQSKIAIGSGGIAGKGYLQGNYTKYQFVPKQDTDFIYCAVGEEFGWIGSTFVLVAFFLLIWRLQYLSENSKTRFARIYGYGVISILFFHVLVNVGMTIGLVPVIGIPLPLLQLWGLLPLEFYGTHLYPRQSLLIPHLCSGLQSLILNKALTVVRLKKRPFANNLADY